MSYNLKAAELLLQYKTRGQFELGTGLLVQPKMQLDCFQVSLSPSYRRTTEYLRDSSQCNTPHHSEPEWENT